MQPTKLDHVALWVENRDYTADFLTTELDVHIVDETDRYTLIGPSAHAGKFTLFDAPEGTEPESERIVSLTIAERDGEHRDPLMTPDGLTLTFVPTSAHPRHSVIGLTLRSSDPTIAAAAYVDRFGFTGLSAHQNVATVGVGDATITLVREQMPAVAQPMLNHLGLLVDSAQRHIDEAREFDIRIADIVDAPNTYAVFLDGPEGITVEYVEHKPAFTLA